jgi:hypothetical protein
MDRFMPWLPDDGRMRLPPASRSGVVYNYALVHRQVATPDRGALLQQAWNPLSFHTLA